MSIVILFFGGLIIGAVFLIILLIGDRRDAIAKAKEEAHRRMADGANAYTAGTWPPPPAERDIPVPMTEAKPSAPKLTARHVNNFHWAIWFFRFFLFAMAGVSYLVHWLFPSMHATGVIAISAAISIGVFALWVVAARGRSR
jgi:hypothetical protein